MLNVRIMSSTGTWPRCCSHRNSGGTSHAPASTTAAVPCGSTRGRLSVMPPPVMCAIPLMRPPSSSGRMQRQVRAVRLEQRLADGACPARHVAVDRRARALEHDPPRQRIAVGVQPGRGHADQHVADGDRAAVDQPLAIDDADDEAGEVVLAVGVEARHLGGLAAEQRAAVLAARRRHAADDRFRDVAATAGRSRGSRGRTAARRPAPGCR